MARVDPFVVQWPAEWMNNPEVRPVIEYLNRFLHDLYLRTGGGTDLIQNLTVNNVYSGQSSKNFIEPNTSGNLVYSEPVEPETANNIYISQPQIEYRAVTVSSNYTALDYDFISVKQGAKITFPEHPVKNSVIIIHNEDGKKVKLDFNGKTVNGSASGNIRRKGSTVVFQYFIDSDKWVPR